MRIIFLSRWFPFPADNGSKIRIWNSLRQLGQQHEVRLLTFYGPDDCVDERSLTVLEECCASVRAVPYRAFRRSSARALAGYVAPRPRSLVDTFSEPMRQALVDEVCTRGCDVLVASEVDMAPYAHAVPHVPAILEDLELAMLHHARRHASSAAQRVQLWLTWVKLGAYLRHSLPRFAACTVASKAEREVLRMLAPEFSRVYVIPNAVDLDQYRDEFGPPEPRTLVYAGALTYDANFDAVRGFLADIYPTITQVMPDILLRVTGRTSGVDMSRLPHHARVQYTGYVDDIRPVVGGSWASIVPLRRGSGTRLKILESMALGTPVVATSKGAEGLAVTSGHDILVADEPAEFALQVLTLLNSHELRQRLAHAGRRLVESTYDVRVTSRSLCALLEQLVADTPGMSRQVMHA